MFSGSGLCVHCFSRLRGLWGKGQWQRRLKLQFQLTDFTNCSRINLAENRRGERRIKVPALKRQCTAGLLDIEADPGSHASREEEAAPDTDLLGQKKGC